MRHAGSPSAPPPTGRRADHGIAVVAGGVLVLTLLIAVGWWGLGQPNGSAVGSTVGGLSGATARGYASQLTKVHLPGPFELIKREHGGTYVAAGNGPYASVSYRTSESLDSAVAQVQEAMEQAGYAVRTAPTMTDGPQAGVIRLEGTAPGRSLAALVGVGVVYDLPFGYVDAGVGAVGVLLVVEDHGRSR